MDYKIMMVEDDADIAELLSSHLQKFGFSVCRCKNFSNVLLEFEEASPHLVLLDINLPAYDGFYWCGKMRAKCPCPIIFLSSRNADSDQVYAMMNGGDDFVTKPFSLDVITAKITALLRRTYGEYAASASGELHCGDCTFSQNRLTMSCNGQEVELSKSYLNAIFKAQTGKSPVEFFIHLKMQEACKLLKSGQTYVYEAAAALGYEDQYYFSRIFKKVVGVSPRDYQNGDYFYPE